MKNSTDQESILIVDDAPQVITLLHNLLKAYYQIFFACNGKEALQTATSKQIDLILLDISMPEMDGFEVCRQLKQNEATKTIPVVFLTAAKDSESETRGLEMGAVDFIAKPINASVVKARIKTHLALRAAQQKMEDLNQHLLYERESLEQKVEQRTLLLTQSNADLQKSLELLEKTSDELIQNEKMASLGRLVAGFTHEINTPIGISITSISNIPEIIRQLQQMLSHEEVDEDELNNAMLQLNENAALGLSSLKKAVDLVSRFKRTSADQTSEESRNINVNDVLQDIIASVHSVFRKTMIAIDLSCSKGITIYSKPGLLGQITTNLLMNSYKHGFNNGTREGLITITVQHDILNQRLHIRYSDNGQGILPENLNIIFEPFFTTARDTGGSGLGLAVCYNIITEQLGGNVSCQSEFGKGVVFDIYIPFPDIIKT